MARIFVTSSSFAEYDAQPLALLKESGFEFGLNTSGKRLNAAQLIDQARGAVAVIAGLEKYDAEVLKNLTDLRCISRCGVGMDSIDAEAARQRGIKIFITPDVVVEPVAEMAIAVILDLLRGITRQTEAMRRQRWERVLGEQLAGKTVGVIGLGRIGRRVAQLLTRFEAKVIAFDIAPDTQWAAHNNVRLLPLDELLSHADIVTLHVSPTAVNPFCLTKQRLAQMKEGAFVVNLSRGECLDEGALEEALKNGRLAGAALDVYRQEPYQGPLCGLANVILTPHIATFTRQSRVQMELQAVRQALDFLKSF